MEKIINFFVLFCFFSFFFLLLLCVGGGGSRAGEKGCDMDVFRDFLFPGHSLDRMHGPTGGYGRVLSSQVFFFDPQMKKK